jgi:hypothetical protein
MANGFGQRWFLHKCHLSPHGALSRRGVESASHCKVKRLSPVSKVTLST